MKTRPTINSENKFTRSRGVAEETLQDLTASSSAKTTEGRGENAKCTEKESLTGFTGFRAAIRNWSFKLLSPFSSREPQKVGTPVYEEIMTMAHRGTLAPQRGEGLRVRGETTSVIETNFLRFMERRTTLIVAAGVSPAVEPWRPARRHNRSLKTSFPSHANLVRFMERTELQAGAQPFFRVSEKAARMLAPWRKKLPALIPAFSSREKVSCPVHSLRSLRSLVAKFLPSPLRASASPRELRFSAAGSPSPLGGERVRVRGGRATHLFSAFSAVSAVKSLFPDIWMQRHVAVSPRELRSPAPHSFSRAGFSLMEVMLAIGVFFMASFAILGLVANTISNARRLQRAPVDAGVLAAELSVTNKLVEGDSSGSLGDSLGKDYADYTWVRHVEEYQSNKLFEVDFAIQTRRNHDTVSKVSFLMFAPQSDAGSMDGGMQHR